MKLAFYRFMGVAFSLIGIGGLAGYSESGNGFVLSILVLVLGIFFIWDESRLNPVDKSKKAKRYEEL